MIRVIIADDHDAIRNAWRLVLSQYPNIEVIDTASGGQEVIDKSRELSPDIVLMDINMEPMTGFEATEILTQNMPSVKVIGLSVNTDPSYAQRMVTAGAKGYVTKTSPSSEMLKAIEEATNGNIYICEEVRKKKS